MRVGRGKRERWEEVGVRVGQGKSESEEGREKHGRR